MYLIFIFAFVSGILTILTPCIWPVLPLVLSYSSASRSRLRPLGITLGLIFSFGFLTLFIANLVRLIGFSPSILRLLGAIIIGFFGIGLIVPPLGRQIEVVLSRLTSRFGRQNNTLKDGFGSGFVTGLSLGLIWAPCAGPILATVATLVALNKVDLFTIFLTFFYLLGVGLPLFLLTLFGQSLFHRLKFLSSRTQILQKVFGFVMIISAVLIFFNFDALLQVKILDLFPNLNTPLAKFENSEIIKSKLDTLKGNLAPIASQAPDFIGVTRWLNTDKPLTLADLKGKVVLVDFWTYTCINCLRTLPHVTSWYDKYRDQGFVVIGVHTPEFEFEKDTTNVTKAIKQLGIRYPVAQDNDYATWNNYQNSYWPAEYLIDSQGRIREQHFGEGNYAQTEAKIQELLAEAGAKTSLPLDSKVDTTPRSNNLSPESYLGAARAQYFYPRQNLTLGNQDFKLNSQLPLHSFSLGGNWTISDHYALTTSNSTLNYHFNAAKVYLVIRPPDGKTAQIKVANDGTPTNSTDVHDGVLNVDTDRLYNLIDLGSVIGDHLLQLEFLTPGTQVFAFTFG